MLSFILNGPNRRKIVKHLLEKESYAQEIAKSEQLTVSSILRTMRALENEGIVECIDPQVRYKKFYRLSSEMRKCKSEIDIIFEREFKMK